MKIKKEKLNIQPPFNEATDFKGFMIVSGHTTAIIIDEKDDEFEIKNLTTKQIIDDEICELIAKKHGMERITIYGTVPFDPENEVYVIGSTYLEEQYSE